MGLVGLFNTGGWACFGPGLSQLGHACPESKHFIVVCRAHTISLASNHFLASNYFLKNLVTFGAKTQIRVTFSCSKLSLIRPTSLISHPKKFHVLSYWSFSFSFPLACVRHPICRLATL